MTLLRESWAAAPRARAEPFWLLSSKSFVSLELGFLITSCSAPREQLGFESLNELVVTRAWRHRHIQDLAGSGSLAGFHRRTGAWIRAVMMRYQGNPKAMMFDPAATAMYCLLSNMNVMGEAFQS